MIFINFCCLILYFVFAFLFLFFLYYFKALPNYVPFRYKFNFFDFILDFLKVLSSDIQNYDPKTFTETGIIIYEGKQGSGKTISMVRDAILIKRKFPDCILVDNLGVKAETDY